ncbi:phosphoribosylformimino-5-aminoimidazole carboxamide ribotide isomerase [Legionella beliardensis]|uniref:1-(5-phosphoribosyl)-5-[(5-phosphoribosylamino)methylideneamino] imidazole-4-carboxamide isomerase n=1 Tax=Legionella beliardensis TaxID=91822 RepID=A0A378IAF4_9GAMM|nr:1-(5-phosphoribosyl)-5-[(5-phosphoribosylamino)methylideneamino] imidazole-4-carboxamide isomerase [Legionella beliardensis]STX29314.1 phosphoribosylformimino-5-aminoimidazole carboxamide ribotide isomerase [Legionella beliardensis]
MKLIPAIDLQQGQCVRLRQGNFNQTTIYPYEPLDLAQRYATQGARHLHIVDLDGAKQGAIQQLPLIKSLQSAGCTLQVGGGIRDLTTAKACLDAGIEQLVLGSIAIDDVETTKEIIQVAGADRIVLALDVFVKDNIHKPAIHGWQTCTETNLWDIADHYQKLDIKNILCTDISCDGMMQGPNFNLYEQAIARFPSLGWQASGGIRDQGDLNALAKLGVRAAILGRMLYQNKSVLSFENVLC